MRVTSVLLRQGVPIAEIPQWLRSQHLAHPKAYDRKRAHVIGEKLCDDVLHVLKADLPSPGTCDIIDINPGPCVWSQKLHELVKPRRHVLVEPFRSLYAARIDPLLEQPNSAYRHVATKAEAFDPKSQLLSNDNLNFYSNSDADNDKKYRVNDCLLLTANLSAAARQAIGFTGSIAKQFLNDYYRSLFVREDFMNRYGMVRLLAWVGEDSRRSIMPESVATRTKQSLQLETTCSVTQVAGPVQFRGIHPPQRRWHELDIENQEKLLQMDQSSKVPPNRQQPRPPPPFASLEPTLESVRKNKSHYPYNQTFIRNLLTLDKELATEDSEWYAQYWLEAEQRFADKSKYSTPNRSLPRQKMYRNLMVQLRTHHNTYLKSKDFIWEQRQLFKSIQRKWTRGWYSSSTSMPLEGEHHKRATKLLKEDQLLHEQRLSIKVDTRALVTKAIDDYRCFDSVKQVLAWNRRSYDPLLVRDNEFYPQNPLTLFDFRPYPDVPPQLGTVDKQVCFDHVCLTLMMYPNHSIAKGIQQLVPAGHDQFIERVPALRDPTKGGWWNLEGVRVRTLHPDLFIAIALAYHDWPHRPHISQLLNLYKGVFDQGPK